MLGKLTARFLTEPDKRVLWKFLYNFGWKGMRAVERHKRRLKRGERFPAFVILSITNACNLSCQGCWVTPSDPPVQLTPETLDRVITASKQQGSYFFGILGGEPLLYPGLLGVLAQHPDCYFQLFTNGTLLSDEIAETLRRLGNVTPLVSIEGLEAVSDERRGGTNVYRRAIDALNVCRRHGLVTGVATSVCQSNFEELVSETFVEKLIEHGVLYVWYYIYRPTGSDPSFDLALDADQVTALRRFMVDTRCRLPIVVVDAYWGHDGRALCPAAAGISHHVNPRADIEPCPPIQFARDNLTNGADVAEVFNGSEFLGKFREMAASHTDGCVLLSHPHELKAFMEEEDARDVTGRGTGLAELAAMSSRPDHHLPGREIPEKHWAYRFAKKRWFFGFGAYG